jgi:non-ribosomal peptide synthetase component E (peptide arylation enzyme)
MEGVIGDRARFEGLSIGDLLGRCAAEEPDRPLVRSSRDTLSYGRAQQQARALAAALHNLGVGAGDRIAIDLLPLT